MNPEKAVSEQSTTDGAALENEFSVYSEIFCKVMSQLNAVALQQSEGLLNIAAQAAEKFRSLNPAAEIDKAELAEFINQMKNAAGSISQINQEAPENPAAHPPVSELFPSMVAQSLNLAFQNSVSNQQAVNQIGETILGKSVALLLSSGGKQS